MSICNWCKPLAIYLSSKVNLYHWCVSSVDSHITNGAPHWTEMVQKLSILKCKLERQSDRKSPPHPTPGPVNYADQASSVVLSLSLPDIYLQQTLPAPVSGANIFPPFTFQRLFASVHLGRGGPPLLPEQDRGSRAWISRCFAFTPMFALVLPNTEGWKSPWYKRLQVPSPYQFWKPLKAGKEE